MSGKYRPFSQNRYKLRDMNAAKVCFWRGISNDLYQERLNTDREKLRSSSHPVYKHTENRCAGHLEPGVVKSKRNTKKWVRKRDNHRQNAGPGDLPNQPCDLIYITCFFENRSSPEAGDHFFIKKFVIWSKIVL